MPPTCQDVATYARSDGECLDGPPVHEQVLSALGEAEEACFTMNQARLCLARQWVRKSWHNVVVMDIKYYWLPKNGPGKKKWVVFEDDPPTKVSEQNCFKVHAHGGVRKYGTTPLFVNVGSKGGRATSKRVNGVVDPILMYEHMIPACEALMAKSPLAEAQHQWIFHQDNANDHA